MAEHPKYDHTIAPKRLFGLIGYPLSHSFSRAHFFQKFEKEGILDAGYELFPLPAISAFAQLLEARPALRGLNVTIPYKLEVIPLLDELDQSAEKAGAVNCIDFRGGKMIGYNTDVYGFEQSLHSWLTALPAKALILGSGGAARAVSCVLKGLGIDYRVVSRSRQKGDLAYGELSPALYQTHCLIINTTPLGMAPNVQTCPDIDFDQLGPQHFLYDLVYNPEKTVFLTKGMKRGCQVKNGLEMLHLQAERAWEIWNR